MSSAPRHERGACYARAATRDQAEPQAAQAQAELLRRYCVQHGLTVAGVYVDDGVSGLVLRHADYEG
jgi:DNA invertase Pin-like site-specific DNA recombinase